MQDCGGKDICEHGKMRQNCRPCGGSAFCEHGRLVLHFVALKHNAKRHSLALYLALSRTACGNADAAVARRGKSKCVLCRGSQACAHGKQKRLCTLCNAHALCRHMLVQRFCFRCKPTQRRGSKRAQNSADGAQDEQDRNKNYCEMCLDGGELVCCDFCECAYRTRRWA